MKKIILMLVLMLFIAGCGIINPIEKIGDGSKKNKYNLMGADINMSYGEIVSILGSPDELRGQKTMQNGKSLKVVEYKISSNKRPWLQDLAVNILISSIAYEAGYQLSQGAGANIPENQRKNEALMTFLASLFIDYNKIIFKDTEQKYWFFFEDNKLITFCHPGDWETQLPPTIRYEFKMVQ